jgi:hypothetical protein
MLVSARPEALDFSHTRGQFVILFFSPLPALAFRRDRFPLQLGGRSVLRGPLHACRGLHRGSVGWLWYVVSLACRDGAAPDGVDPSKLD